MIKSKMSECVICGKPIKPNKADRAPVCHHWQCRQKFRLKQQLAYRKAETDRRASSLKASIEQARRLRDEADSSPNGVEPAVYRPIIIPANQRRLKPLPRRRRYRFTKRLLRLLESTKLPDQDSARAVSPGNHSREGEGGLLPVLGAACATCGGNCCILGGTHAFLNEDLVQKLMQEKGHRDSREIVNSYVQRLPKTSYAGSCVFHSEFGCTLDREMRSNTCNNSICGGFGELRNLVEIDEETRFFLAATKNGKIVRTQFVSAEKTNSNPSENSK